MQVAVLVANPAASQFTGGLHRAVVRGLARRYEVHALWPHGPAEAQQAAADAARDQAALVVAMGGDGVVHHVAQGLVGTDTVLGVLPVGTTNVVARLLGVPRRPSAALKLLLGDFESSLEPVIELEAETEDEPFRRMATFALGVGADALVVREAETEPYRKYRFGGIHYARTTVAVAWRELRHQRAVATLRAGDRQAEVLGMMAQFRSAYTYFGPVPLRLSPRPPHPMTVLALSEFRMRRAVSITRGALGRGGLGRVSGFQLWEGIEEVTLDSPEPLIAQADGELLPPVLRLTARFRPGALPVAVPLRALSAR